MPFATPKPRIGASRRGRFDDGFFRVRWDRATRAEQQAAPGRYAVAAILVSLSIRSPEGDLEVVADAGETPARPA